MEIVLGRGEGDGMGVDKVKKSRKPCTNKTRITKLSKRTLRTVYLSVLKDPPKLARKKLNLDETDTTEVF